ncbi:RNA polymerase subunit sigma-70 [Luteimicrobium subarcticum]|uniref:RNA polymerase sigma-70 factor (ECF subfamily) n=1 Tax=Luteimicrobium subarcticum TaxID=620910 RepID=A0A2M8W6R4_9MICO|nr:RNA polymerase subunit sigma-70 [Luteimicrobium subarcticum]PJI86621.1 RNA polymerase sigma-70 factor (ECF subfamily) [Luteimicrobium subarcticum]
MSIEDAATDVLERARGGDETAFERLVRPHRRELQAHCYRMLGSLQDAEDALQETLLAAWRGVGAFEARSSVRTWLYRIATNRCLNARRAAGRRPPAAWAVPGLEPPPPTRFGEVAWLEPAPASWTDGLTDVSAGPAGPEGRYVQRETVSLAFVTALQQLTPRQAAVLVLRDVLGFPAREVADLLGTSTESVTSALKRARAGMGRYRETVAGREPSPAAGSHREDAVAARFAAAYVAGDVEGVVALLTDDAFMAMPPVPFEYVGRAAVGAFCAALFAMPRELGLVPTRASEQPAFGQYARMDDGSWRAAGLVTVALAGDRVCELSRFDPALLERFGLPSTLPADDARVVRRGR